MRHTFYRKIASIADQVYVAAELEVCILQSRTDIDTAVGQVDSWKSMRNKWLQNQPHNATIAVSIHSNIRHTGLSYYYLILHHYLLTPSTHDLSMTWLTQTWPERCLPCRPSTRQPNRPGNERWHSCRTGPCYHLRPGSDPSRLQVH